MLWIYGFIFGHKKHLHPKNNFYTDSYFCTHSTNPQYIRRDLKAVRKQWKQCAEHEKEHIKAIRDDVIKQLEILRTAERNRQMRQRRAKAQSKFIKSPFNCVKTRLGNPKGRDLQSEIQDVEQHLKYAYNDEYAHTKLDECSALISPTEPTIQFKISEIQLKEVEEAVKRARARI